ALLSADPASAQDPLRVVEHSSFKIDDGNPDKDWCGFVAGAPCGPKDGIVRFKPGVRHVITTTRYRVEGLTSESVGLLIIAPGAVVEDGGIEGYNRAGIQIDEGTLKRTTIGHFFGADSHIKNSNLSDLTISLPQGSELSNTRLSNCQIWTTSPADVFNLEIESPPYVQFNYMEDTSIHAVGSPIVIIANTMVGSVKGRSDHHILLEPQRYDNRYYPTGHIQTKILDNTIHGRGGIRIESGTQGLTPHDELDAFPVSALIQGNTLVGEPAHSGAGIDVETFGNTQVLENEVRDFNIAIGVRTVYTEPGATVTRPPSDEFRIANNVLDRSNAHGMSWAGGQSPRGPIPDQKGFVDARFNWWGEPDGPSDLSNADGYYHEGNGLSVDDQILYSPYQGTAQILTEQILEVRHPEDLNGELLTLVKGATYKFDVRIHYSLFSGPATLTLNVVDSEGRTLVDPVPAFQVEAGAMTLEIDELEVLIPEDATSLGFQSQITSATGAGSLSEEVTFAVFDPLYLLATSDPILIPHSGSGLQEPGKTMYVPGVATRISFDATYSYPNLPDILQADIVVRPQEWIEHSSIPDLHLSTLPVRTFSIDPGENRTVEVVYDLTTDLRDYVVTTNLWNGEFPFRTIRFVVELRINGTTMASTTRRNFVNDAANAIVCEKARSAIPLENLRIGDDLTCLPTTHSGHSYFLPNARAQFVLDKCSYRAETPFHLSDYANWKIDWTVEFSDGQGAVIPSEASDIQWQITELHRTVYYWCADFEVDVPEAAKKADIVARTTTPGGIVTSERRIVLRPAPVSRVAQ
ncbi:MAG: hypothetical protein HKN13_02925, partial [Rhodothermales bacterium]|nr:hypothetical protein [Rhodothermales bacterium]